MTLHEAHDALTIAASALEHSEAKKEFYAAKAKLEASLEFKAHKAAKELLSEVSERYKDSAKTFSNRKFGKGHLVKNAGKLADSTFRQHLSFSIYAAQLSHTFPKNTTLKS